ncbi:MAG: S4 domain-containing protein [Sphingosinicella sp.]
MADTLRPDKFLRFARIVRTRARAQALAEQGRIRLSGRLVDKAHAPVRVGEVLSFAHRGRVRVIRVEQLPQRRGSPEQSRRVYCELTSEGSAS